MGSIPDNTETPDLLDEGSQQLGIWHPDDGHQDNGNKEEQGTSTAITAEWHDAESVNTQKTTLRRDASDVEEAALDEESTATRGSLRDSESLEDSETVDFSQTVGFNEEALEQADRAEPRRGTRARNVQQFFGEVSTHPAVTEDNYVEPKTVYEAKQADEWDQWFRAMNDKVKAFQNNETWDLVRPPTDSDVIPGKWVYKLKLDPVVKSTNTKHAVWQIFSNKWKDWTTLRFLRLPVSHRQSVFYFSYQRSRAMRCTNLMSKLLSCTHQSRKKCIWTVTVVCKTRIRWGENSMLTKKINLWFETGC